MPSPTVFIVDDDAAVRALVRGVAQSVGLVTESFAGGSEFLGAVDGERPGCVMLDLRLPGMSGFEVLAELRGRDVHMPAIVMTGYADVGVAVKAMRAGAHDFVEKPFGGQAILERIQAAVEIDRQRRRATARFAEFTIRLIRLTPREREVLGLIVAGHTNNDIAHELTLSRKTVETHRANLMAKTGVDSLAELIRFGLQAGALAERQRST
ncbi:MAG: response regulator transcription factor [Candidatus Binatia bacterium]